MGEDMQHDEDCVKSSRMWPCRLPSCCCGFTLSTLCHTGVRVHLHGQFGLPMARHSAMVLILPARAAQSEQCLPDLVLPRTHL